MSTPPREALPNQSDRKSRVAARIVTSLLIVVNVGVTIWIRWLAVHRLYDDAAFGANVAAVFVDHKWWVLVTATFVHELWTHLIPNMVEVWFFGNRVGVILGVPLYLLIYIAGGAVGNLVTLYMHPNGNTFGASGAGMALLGALITYYGFHYNQLSVSGVLKYLALVVWAAIEVLGDLFDRANGIVAHPVGFGVGVVVALLYCLRARGGSPWKQAPASA